MSNPMPAEAPQEPMSEASEVTCPHCGQSFPVEVTAKADEAEPVKSGKDAAMEKISAYTGGE